MAITDVFDKGEKPAKLKEVLAQDRAQYDCMPCRITGGAAFIGLGAYGFLSGHSQLRNREKEILKAKPYFGIKARRMGVTGTAAVLVGMGLYRIFV